MEKRRDCVAVIASILELVPTEKTDLIKDLEWNMDDASYKAPEENIQWIRTSETLQKHIELPSEEWEFEVLSIFSTQSVNDIKKGVEEYKKQNNLQ